MVQAIPSNDMNVFRLLKGSCDDIARIFTHFWRGSTNDKKKVHWMSWERLCLSKELGGLNCQDLEDFNNARIAKQAWRFLHNPSLLASKVLKAIYLPDSTLIEADVQSRSSYFWKSLI